MVTIIQSCQKEISDQITATNNLPVVVTKNISGVTDTAATGAGDVIADGGTPVTIRGLCWSLSVNPTISDNQSANGIGLGSFAHTMTGLLPSTTYHVRAYATNNAGTAYGADSSFITASASSLLPAVVTATITSITSTGATGGGHVIGDGGSAVT